MRTGELMHLLTAEAEDVIRGSGGALHSIESDENEKENDEEEEEEEEREGEEKWFNFLPGQYAAVLVSEAEGPTLRGTAYARSSMQEWHQQK